MVNPSIRHVVKRDGQIAPFNREKILNALRKAFNASDLENDDLAKKISNKVIQNLSKLSQDHIPSIEDIQDQVEKTLISEGLDEIAKVYIIYRNKRAEARHAKNLVGVHDDLKLSVNAAVVLQKRYLLKDNNGNIIETPSQMFKRVSKTISAVDKNFGKSSSKSEKLFYNSISNLEFLPNSPTLMNSGTKMGQLAACFVLPVEDSMTGIFNSIKNMALIHQSGGGTGFSFSRIRPIGDIVKSTQGIASGPLSFMSIFDAAADVIKQGGRRRGANMGVLSVDHPDIMRFIGSKSKEQYLTNFNISVAVTDKFMEKVRNDEEYSLVNPRNKKVVGHKSARDVFEYMLTMAWSTGDPGLIFIDRINQANPTPNIGKIESTNPCGEQPLLPYESCTLGSVNLARMVKNDAIDWEKLRNTTELAVHFLDNVIDANRYSLKKIEIVTKSNRKIGLGIMGFSEMLIQLRVPYASKKAISIASKIMQFISKTAISKSIILGEIRGNFPNFKDSVWAKRGYNFMRNATLTTVAPTGTISIIAGCSSGIEPIFAVSYARNILEGSKLLETNQYFEKIAKNEHFFSEKLMQEIAKTGSIQNYKKIPDNIKKLFQTAFDIKPEWHVRIQAAFQKYTDNAVSKTVNLPSDASIDDVQKIYDLAYDLGCKGVTIYRYGSKANQVLYIDNSEQTADPQLLVRASSEYSGGCLNPACNLY